MNKVLKNNLSNTSFIYSYNKHVSRLYIQSPRIFILSFLLFFFSYILYFVVKPIYFRFFYRWKKSVISLYHYIFFMSTLIIPTPNKNYSNA